MSTHSSPGLLTEKRSDNVFMAIWNASMRGNGYVVVSGERQEQLGQQIDLPSSVVEAEVCWHAQVPLGHHVGV